MANLTPVQGWDDVPQLEITTQAKGGPGGPMNTQSQALLDRTELLNPDNLQPPTTLKPTATWSGKQDGVWTQITTGDVASVAASLIPVATHAATGTVTVGTTLDISAGVLDVHRDMRTNSDTTPSLISLSGVSAQWALLGTLTSAQTAGAVEIRITGGVDAPPVVAQATIIARVNLGQTPNAEVAYVVQGNKDLVQAVKLQSVNGTATDTQWKLYALVGAKGGNSMLRVTHVDGTTWVFGGDPDNGMAGAATTDPGPADGSLIIAAIQAPFDVAATQTTLGTVELAPAAPNAGTTPDASKTVTTAGASFVGPLDQLYSTWNSTKNWSTSNSSVWVLLGRFTSAQQGSVLTVKVNAGVGFSTYAGEASITFKIQDTLLSPNITGKFSNEGVTLIVGAKAVSVNGTTADTSWDIYVQTATGGANGNGFWKAETTSGATFVIQNQTANDPGPASALISVAVSRIALGADAITTTARPTFNGNLAWDAGNLNFAIPPVIGATTPNDATFHNLTVTGTFSAPFPGRLIGMQRFVANGAYTPTPGTSFAIIEGCGGGGGGGGLAASNIAGSIAMGGTGGGGAFGKVMWQNPTPQSVTIGAGGAAGTSGGGAGGAGGQTSIGTILVCPGGGGGTAGTNRSFQGTVIVIDGALGGAVATSAGTTPIYLSAGFPGDPQLSHYNGSGAGMGYAGSSPYGIGGNAAHTAPSGFGSGGGAYTGYQTTSAIAGGVGLSGLLIVWEYSA
ncbi:hypothetical protein [Paraburkholderia caribensis]|uniref:hypothetical protein n=1 Tax=Paraburkholderia caribensis TaxID=75105 RepID=UPI0020908553|nr:hypothetical protein [Paraburkholderia caribensis]MCO4880225.1 hypothetical protein [Paraburkholderia caribensis]